jgi:hypothetical protein
MSLHIHRFVDLVTAAESRGQTSIVMPLAAAKDLHADITRLLLKLQHSETRTSPAETPVELQGGTFKNS